MWWLFLQNVYFLTIKFSMLTYQIVIMTVYNSVQLTNVIKEYLAPTLTNTRWIWPNNFWIVNLWLCVKCNNHTFQVGGHWHEGICFPNNIQDMHISCFWSKCFEKHELQKICGLLSGKWTLFDNPIYLYGGLRSMWIFAF